MNIGIIHFADKNRINMHTCFEIKKPKVSVIVPVYNTEQYLVQCLNSICGQSLSEIEVIVIDDGSTDNSSLICDSFAERDSRFKIIHKNNEGLSAARNCGIDIARADYIMFVDSDDYVSPNFCEVPYKIMEKTGADITIFQFMKYGGKRAFTKSFPIEGITPKKDVLTWLWRYTWAAAWNKIYRKSLFDGIKYPVGHLYEDDAITHRIVYKADSIFISNECLYYYRNSRTGSITNTKSKTLMIDYFTSRFNRVTDLKRWGYDYKNEQLIVALSYLAIMGRHEKLSTMCDSIVKNSEMKWGNAVPWKHSLLLWTYHISPILFDIISICTGRRINNTQVL